MSNKLITILFCGLLAAGIIAEILLPDKLYSDSEKRKLAQFPQLSPEEILDGKLSDSAEDYLADQFPGRDGWVTAKVLTELISGKRESGGVYFAQDGYLIDKFTTYSQKQFAANINTLCKLEETLSQSGIPMKVMLVPTAADILSDKLPAFAPNLSQSDFISYAEKQDLDVTDVSDILREHSGEYIYYKTDHHWTSLGAYYAYCAWKSSKGETAEALSAWTHEKLCDNFRGTTYAKVNYPFAPFDTIDAYYKQTENTVSYNDGAYVTDSLYERKYLDGSDQYAAFLNSNQALTVISGSGTGKLLIIKDSYANTFAQFPADDYAETYLIDMRFYRGSVSKYAVDNGITDVLVLYNIPNFASDKSVSMIY